MVRKLYHGSCSIIEKPVFGQGKRYNDYGLGFYCTDSLEMAKEWGVSHDKDGYARPVPGCDGLKTGYINAGGSSVVLTGTNKGRRAIVIVLGSASASLRDSHARSLMVDALSAL